MAARFRDGGGAKREALSSRIDAALEASTVAVQRSMPWSLPRWAIIAAVASVASPRP